MSSGWDMTDARCSGDCQRGLTYDCYGIWQAHRPHLDLGLSSTQLHAQVMVCLLRPRSRRSLLLLRLCQTLREVLMRPVTYLAVTTRLSTSGTGFEDSSDSATSVNV